MKHPIITTTCLATLLLSLTGLAGCTQNELPREEDNLRTPLTVQVSDNGYTPVPDEPTSTRTTDTDYKTTFTAGDRIGLYAVRDGAVLPSYNNLCLTLTDDGSDNLSWAGTVHYEGTSATYYAYYPYQDDMTDQVNAAATNADGFFAPLVNGWTPATDQSTPTLYTAQDLMTGSGVVAGSSTARTLAFSLTHRMALAILETPITQYTLSTDATYPTWLAPAPYMTFNSFAPCPLSISSYRYIVKQNSPQTKLSATYIDVADKTKIFLFTPDATASRYKTYTVDGGAATVIPKNYTLQMGDLYLKAGSLVSKDEMLTWIQKAACLGVVFKAGKDASDNCDYKLKDGATPMTTIHGYVLALRNVNNNQKCAWGSPDIMIGDGAGNTSDNTGLIQGQEQPYKAPGFYGYKFTNIIKKYATDNGLTLQNDFPAAYLATAVYENKCPAPDNTSGWFLLSAGQGSHWITNKDLLNSTIQKVTGHLSWTAYWTSSERYPGTAWFVNSADFGYIVQVTKGDSNRYVRSLLAF